MLFTPNLNTLQHQHQSVLGLLKKQESVVVHDIRALLGCSATEVHAVLEELIAQGLVRAHTLRNSTHYSQREFDHDPALVRPEWFEVLQESFVGGKTNSASGIARLLDLNTGEVRSTLEEMRRVGILYGKFIGQMCVYSLRQRGTIRQASSEQLHNIENTHEKQQQRAIAAAGAARSLRKTRTPVQS